MDHLNVFNLYKLNKLFLNKITHQKLLIISQNRYLTAQGQAYIITSSTEKCYSNL